MPIDEFDLDFKLRTMAEKCYQLQKEADTWDETCCIIHQELREACAIGVIEAMSHEADALRHLATVIQAMGEE